MKREDIESIIDACFDKELNCIQDKVSMELYPDAFANEYSWLRVKAVFDLNNCAIRSAVKNSISQIFAAED